MKKILYSIVMAISFLSVPKAYCQSICDNLVATDAQWSSELLGTDGLPYFDNVCGENGRIILTKFIAVAPDLNNPLLIRTRFQFLNTEYGNAEIYYREDPADDFIKLQETITPLASDPLYSTAEAEYTIQNKQVWYEFQFRVWPLAPFNGTIIGFGFELDHFDDISNSWNHCPGLDEGGYNINNIFGSGVATYNYDYIVDPNNTTYSNGAIPFQNTYNGGLRIETEFIVDQDLLLDASSLPGREANITMHPGAKIIVTNNATLTLRNRKVQSCGIPWESIIVENGSTLIADENVSFDGALSAITLHSGASLQLGGTDEVGADPNTIFTNCDIGVNTIYDALTLPVNIEAEDATFQGCTFGMFIEGDSDIDIMARNTFDNCIDGLHIAGKSIMYNFNNNHFKECFYGVRLVFTPNIVNLTAINKNNANTFTSCYRGIQVTHSSAKIRNNIFESCFIGTVVSRSTFTDFCNNEVEYDKIGFWAHRSTYHVLSNEFFFSNNLLWLEEIASISSFGFCNNSLIENNIINPARRGIIVMNETDLEIKENTINVHQDVEWSNSAGIEMLTSDVHVHHNTLELTNADGILINSSIAGANNPINNNTITSLEGSQRSGIRIDGSTAVNTNNNLICGDFSDGIRVLNSTNNTFDCNNITTNVRGIFIANNSAAQDIRGNTTASYSTGHTGKNNILIRSQIGDQKHNGNIFYGSDNENSCDFELSAESWVRAEGITPNFQFTIDLDLNNGPLIPEGWTPQSIFMHETLDPNSKSYECIDLPGANFQGPIFNDVELCNFISNLSELQETNPNKYWINMYHTYKSYLWFSDFSSWPSCLQEQWENESFCGIKSIVQAETDLFLVRKSAYEGNEEESIANELITLIDEEGDSESINELLNTLSELKDQRIANVDEEILAQEDLINSIDCDGELVNNWKSTYLMLLQYIKGEEELNEENIEELQTTASLCAKEYGESVHWARGMIAKTDQIIYDNIDECNDDYEKPTQVNNENLASGVIEIFPNPTSDFLNLSVDYQGEVTYQITDVTGKIVKDFKSSNNTIIDVSDFKSGLYIIYINDANNNESTSKFVVK